MYTGIELDGMNMSGSLTFRPEQNVAWECAETQVIGIVKLQ